MPRKKKYESHQLINCIRGYILTLSYSKIITATEIAEWANKEKYFDTAVRYQTFTRSPEASNYIENYNKFVQEAQDRSPDQERVAYVTMDINAEVAETSSVEKRRKRFIELDNTLERMASNNARLYRKQEDLKRKLNQEKSDRDVLERDMQELNKKNQELSEEVRILTGKIKELKQMEARYVAYIEEYLYMPVMRAQLALAGVVEMKDGAQVLPTEFEPLMIAFNTPDKIRAFIRKMDKANFEIITGVEQSPDPPTIQDTDKIVPWKERLKTKLKGLEE